MSNAALLHADCDCCLDVAGICNHDAADECTNAEYYSFDDCYYCDFDPGPVGGHQMCWSCFGALLCNFYTTHGTFNNAYADWTHDDMRAFLTRRYVLTKTRTAYPPYPCIWTYEGRLYIDTMRYFNVSILLYPYDATDPCLAVTREWYTENYVPGCLAYVFHAHNPWSLIYWLYDENWNDVLCSANVFPVEAQCYPEYRRNPVAALTQKVAYDGWYGPCGTYRAVINDDRNMDSVATVRRIDEYGTPKNPVESHGCGH